MGRALMEHTATGSGAEPRSLEESVEFVTGRMRHVLALIDRTSSTEEAASYLAAMADGILGSCIAIGVEVHRRNASRAH